MKLNNKHRVLSVVLLMLVMMLSFASVVAFADDGNSTNVAKAGNNEYATLAKAIAAAKDGETVTLLADATEDVTINKNITRDLGSKALTNTNSGKATITIANGATVTVKNGNVVGGKSYYNIAIGKAVKSTAKLTLEGVTATAGNTGSSMIDNWGTLTINSGDYSGGLNVVKSEEGSTLVINGGKFTLDYATSGYTGVILSAGITTISGGEFIQNATTPSGGNPQVVLAMQVDGYTSKIEITGGTFTNKKFGSTIFHGYGKATSDNFEVSGGTFNKSISDGFCADGFIPTKNADGTYGVAGPYEAKIDSTVYETLDAAIAAANKSSVSKTIKLLEDLTVDHQILIKNDNGKAITLDLGGKTLTSTLDANGYSLRTDTKVTIKNGTYKGTGNARGIGAYADFVLDRVKVDVAGLVGVACSTGGKTYEIKNSEVKAGYAVCNFADNATITISGSKLTGTGNVLYHNGSNYGLKLTVTNSTITGVGDDCCGVYISGSTSAQANSANQNGAGGYQQASFTNCTISGTNGIEVKYTDLTLDGCDVKTTAAKSSYTQNNNGPASSGFAVVSTDNAMNNTTPKPEGTIIIKGEGKYTGPVGLGSLKSVKNTYKDFKDETIKVSAGTFSSRVPSSYCAEGFVPVKNSDGSYSVKEGSFVAEVNGEKYTTLQEAIAAAARNSTVKLIADTCENVTISTPYVTLDLNGFTLNGGREKGKPALTVTARVTVKDSSEAQTGTIMREDTAENSGVSSHYVIDIQGSGWLTFESGKVTNNSGNTAGKGASLVRVGDDSVAKYPGLNIKGGTFTQDNFIVIKVDRGDLFLNGGTLNSAKSYAIENWLRATIKGGTVNGAVSSWTYSGGSNSTLTISGGTVNGNVESVSYDGSAGKKASVSITGGTVNGTLSTKLYNDTTTPGKDVATIEVTGGTFKKDPTKYVIEDSAITANADGTFGVAKAYLAKVGNTSYYTMDEAFKAQTASGEAIVLLRDYTTGSTFNSGTINRTVDLSGFTWTCTGTDANSAAFEINNPNVTLTVKNGKVVSSQLVGLIPSAMGGTITYDNSGLVFESVEMSTTATSGIETNGNNTNDSVTLRNSTLNVPNGFGIYFPSSGTLTIDNSTINAKTMGVQVCAGSLSINEGSAVTVSGDAVPKAENDGAIQDGAAISIVNRSGYKGLDTVTITGGTFKAKSGNAAIKAYNWAEDKTASDFTASEKVAVSGGKFSTAVPEAYCAKGFIPTENTDGTYGVKEGKYVASIGDTKYVSLAEAIAAAKDGETVKFLADVTENVIIAAEKNIILDLNGHTLSGGTTAGKAALTNYGELTINDSSEAQTGTIKREDNNTSGYYVIDNKGKMTINGGNVINNSSRNGSSLIRNGGAEDDNAYPTLNIIGGTFTQMNFIAIKNDALSILNVSGGKITSNASAIQNWYKATITGGEINGQLWTDAFAWNGGESIGNTTISGNAKFNGEIVMDITGQNVVPKLNISGGDLNVTNWRITTNASAAGAKPAVSGGTFSSAVPNDYCAEGYVTVKNSDGTYGVKEGKYVAEVNGKKYETLQAAVDAATNGQTVTLIADVDLTETLIIKDKTITLDLNGKTISNSTDIWNEGTYSWSLISVRDNGVLTIDDIVGGGTLKAKENDCFTLDVYADDTKNVENTRLIVNAGNYIGNISAVYAYTGKVTINGGHFSIQQKESGSDPYRLTLNCYDSSYTAGRAGFTVNGGTFENFDPRNNLAEGAGTCFVADGVGVDKNTDGTFTAKSGMAAQIVDANGNSVAAYAGHYDAIAAAKDGEKVILLSDRKNFVTNTINANITIDLNGKTLSDGNNNPFFRTNGEVTIQNGTITSNLPCVIVNAYNKLTLKNVKITGVTDDSGMNLVNVCSNAEVTIDKDTVLTASGSKGAAVFIGQDADAKYTLNVYGKVIRESKSFAVSGNGSYKGTTTINIYEGAEVKSASVAIYHPQAGVINVNGGLVEGYCAIGIKSGTLNINGGTVRGTADDHVLDDSNSTSGTITYDGSAIIVDSRSTGYAGNVNINVTGGTVESYYSTAIREIGEQDKPNMTQLTQLKVTGGSVLGASQELGNVTNDMLVRDISVNNVSVSGGTFNHAVPSDYCAESFEPAENGDGTYGVKKVETPAKENKKLSIDFGNGEIEIRTGSQLFTYISHFTNAEFEKNLNYTATYKPSANHVFLYWLNESGRIISEQANYSFYLTYDTKLSAMSFTVDNSKRYVVFRDMNDKVLHSSEYTVDGNGNVVVDVPVTSGFTGFVFENWVDASGTVLTVENGKITIPAGDAKKAIMIKAKYRSADTEYTVTVTDGTFEGTGETSKTFKYGESCTVVAQDTKDGKAFLGWYAGETLMSTNPQYSFAVVGSVVLTPCYGDSSVPSAVLGIVTSERTQNGDGTQIVTITLTWSVPNNYKIVSAGILSTSESVYNSNDELNLNYTDSLNIYNDVSTLKTTSGTYPLTLKLGKVSSAKDLYVRGYLQYIADDSGEVITVYTDIFVSKA